jgi:hypothetical protein
MKVSKTLVLKIVAVLILVFIALNALGYLSGVLYIKADIRKGKQRQMRLLCETNYQVLLEACRQLSSRVAAGDLKPQQYNIRLKPNPESSRFPQPILDLEPTYVIIGADGIVQIELHGGFLHYGVIAYPEDYKEPPYSFKYGDRKLIDGLWYYDEGYEGNPEYQKKIEALIEEGKARQSGQ